MSNNIWERYKTADESVICMAGIIALCVCLCKVDGDFSKDELNAVLDIIPHTEDERDYLLELINQINENDQDYVFHAQNIKKYISNQPAFFDFIIATLYKLAWADHILDDSELELITNTNEIFKQEEVA